MLGQYLEKNALPHKKDFLNGLMLLSQAVKCKNVGFRVYGLFYAEICAWGRSPIHHWGNSVSGTWASDLP